MFLKRMLSICSEKRTNISEQGIAAVIIIFIVELTALLSILLSFSAIDRVITGNIEMPIEDNIPTGRLNTVIA